MRERNRTGWEREADETIEMEREREGSGQGVLPAESQKRNGPNLPINKSLWC